MAKNTMHTVNQKKAKNNKIVLEGGHVKTKIENIHQHLQEINRGTGVTKNKKKYDRKKSKPINYKDDCSFYFLSFTHFSILL